MSKMSRVYEKALKHAAFKKRTDDIDMAHEHLEERSLEEDEPYKLPKRIYHTKVKIEELFGCQMVIFNENPDTERFIIYLHGGAYVNEILTLHIEFCDKLAKKANATVIAPIYPLAPNHTYKETYEIVEKLYSDVLKRNKPIAMMGDSAGGGLSAAFCEYLAYGDLPQPQHLILLSPWVDVSMSGDYDEYRDIDPMLGVEGAREMGKAWAGDLDLKDYRISPMFGDMMSLPQTTLFVGTHEILYPDVVEFYNRLRGSGVNVELIIGREMTHVYPVYPGVPESKEALNQIVDILLG